MLLIKARGHSHLPINALNQNIPNRYVYKDVTGVVIIKEEAEIPPRGVSVKVTGCFTRQQVKEEAQLAAS